jgi:hypothetical protein
MKTLYHIWCLLRTLRSLLSILKCRYVDILRKNCLLKQVIEGKIMEEMEVARRRGRRRKKLLDDLKDRRGYSRLIEEALDRTVWRNRFRGGFGPVVRQNNEWMMNVEVCPYPATARVDSFLLCGLVTYSSNNLHWKSADHWDKRAIATNTYGRRLCVSII